MTYPSAGMCCLPIFAARDRGWEWRVTTDGSTTRWRTDARGTGLWRWSDTGQCWQQGLGHLQFDLRAAHTPQQAQAAIEAHWRQRETEAAG